MVMRHSLTMEFKDKPLIRVLLNVAIGSLVLFKFNPYVQAFSILSSEIIFDCLHRST